MQSFTVNWGFGCGRKVIFYSQKISEMAQKGSKESQQKQQKKNQSRTSSISSTSHFHKIEI